jgi:hypothetical protein
MHIYKLIKNNNYVIIKRINLYNLIQTGEQVKKIK